MTQPLKRILLFCGLLVFLFAAELAEPVQVGLIEPFTALIAKISASLIQLFDSSVTSQGIVIRDTENNAAVAIQPGCNGVEAMIVLTAAVLACPAPWIYRAIGLLIGFLAIQALNLVRIISLFYLLQWNQTFFEWAHLYLWQALIILDALIVFVLWLRMLPPEPYPPTEAHA
ncbi:MAG: exosortase H [Candidatus Competibacteraceae bacterium]|nr:exosortase H [Candidatus Competibacteraceae bacterium]